MCLYVMDAFDSDCTRCHGKGAAQPGARAQPPAVAQQQGTLPAPPQPPSQTIIPKSYVPPARSLGAYMFGSMDGARNNNARITQALALFACLVVLASAIAYSVNAMNERDDNRPENIQQSILR